MWLISRLEPPTELLNKYDVVCSFGVVEHFSDTSVALKAAAAFLKPGGMLITTIPNHNGLTGFLQKLFSKEIYEIHKILDSTQVDHASNEAGLLIIDSGYFINYSLYANPGIPGPGNPWYPIKRIILKATAMLSRIIWWVDLYLKEIRPKKSYSAAIFSISSKQAD